MEVRHSRALCPFLLFLAFATHSAPCGASSLPSELNYEAMIEKADFIIVGNVTRIHGNTFTYVTVGIEEFVTNPQNMS